MKSQKFIHTHFLLCPWIWRIFICVWIYGFQGSGSPFWVGGLAFWDDTKMGTKQKFFGRAVCQDSWGGLWAGTYIRLHCAFMWVFSLSSLVFCPWFLGFLFWVWGFVQDFRRAKWETGWYSFVSLIRQQAKRSSIHKSVAFWKRLKLQFSFLSLKNYQDYKVQSWHCNRVIP